MLLVSGGSVGAGTLIAGLSVSGLIPFNSFAGLWSVIAVINGVYYLSVCCLIPTYEFILKRYGQRHAYGMAEKEQKHRQDIEREELEHRWKIEEQIDPKELYRMKYMKDRDKDHEYRMEKLKGENSGTGDNLQGSRYIPPPDAIDITKYMK